MMDVDVRLLKLEEARKELKRRVKDRECSNAFWMLFKYHAQDKPWWDELIHGLIDGQWIPWSEIKYWTTKNDEVDDSLVTLDYGRKLWRERRKILKDIYDLESLIDELLEDLYCNDVVPLELIGEYFGSGGSGAFNHMKDKPWFRHRKKPLDKTYKIA